jgi:hypothetical protein
MKDLETRVAQPETAPLTAKSGALAADVARALLAQPAGGLTRIAYVGLPEREAVQLVLDAHEQGLQAETTRGAAGRVSVTLTAPAEAAAAGEPAPETPGASAWPGAWARQWKHPWRALGALGRRTR